MEGLKPEYLSRFSGIQRAAAFLGAFHSLPRRKAYVTADPGYEAGMRPQKSPERPASSKRPLTIYAHECQGHGGRRAGRRPSSSVYAQQSDRNPMTPHSTSNSYSPRNQKVGGLVDEAYIHFSNGSFVLDLVKANQDVIRLAHLFRRFTDMAGIRCAMAIGRPTYCEKLETYNSGSALADYRGGGRNRQLEARAPAVPERP